MMTAGWKQENPPEVLAALTDGELFSRFVDGDQRAFTTLYSRYSGRVLGFVQSYLGNGNAGADDVFQETFIRLYRQRRKYRRQRETAPLKNVGGWLFRVARNLSLNQLRDQAHLVELPDLSTEQLVTRPSEAFPRLYGEDVEQELLLEQVRIAVAELPESLREVFVLREVNGMSYEETADIVGCTVEAARMRLSRARTRIRDIVNSRRERAGF